MSRITLKEMVERFKKVKTASVSDAMNFFGAMDCEIKPLVEGSKIAGPALTVKSYPGDELTLLKAIERVKPGEVIVVDARGSKVAALGGGIMFGLCFLKGAEGVVIDGATRDLDEIRGYPFPVFARALVPTSAVSKSMGEINVPIQCGGVNVNPGDIVVGDNDGVVVVPREKAESILEIAEKISRLDDMTIEAVKQKKPIDEIMKNRKLIQKEIEEMKRKLR